jgi:acyl-CoA thioester hydrolase
MMNDELKKPRKRHAKRSSLITHHSSPRVFSWPVRVYYEDTDLGGVVYYANYLKFLERARTEWLRARGFEQTALAAVHEVMFIVRSVALDYRKPARFNDQLEVTVELREIGASRIALHQRVRRGKEELAAAHVEIACVNTATFRPVRIPEPVIARIGNKT